MDLLTSLNFNSDSRLSGSVIFTFATDKWAPEKTLGNVKSSNYDNNAETRKRAANVCGRAKHVDSINISSEPTATVKIEDFNRENIKSILLASEGQSITQPALAAVTIDPIAGALDTVELHKARQGGEPVYNIESMVLTDGANVLVEDLDYAVVSMRFGTIRFLTIPAGDVAVEVTASSLNTTPLILGSANPNKGYIRMYYYPLAETAGKQCEPEIVIEGEAVVEPEGSLEFSVENDSEFDLKCVFSGDPRLVDLREL